MEILREILSLSIAVSAAPPPNSNLSGNYSVIQREVVDDWMTSSGHRENILRPEFKSIAVSAVDTDDGTRWVQLFSCTKGDSTLPPVTPEPPITPEPPVNPPLGESGNGGSTSSSGSGGSGSGGSSGSFSRKADTNRTVTTTTPKKSNNVLANGSIDKVKIIEEVAASIKSSKTNTATVQTKNATLITADVIKELASLGNKSGKTITLYADTYFRKGVEGRLYVKPELLLSRTNSLKLGVYTNPTKTLALKSRFERSFSNKISVVHLEQEGSLGACLQVAAKVDVSQLNVKNLVFYNFNNATNKYFIISNPNYSIDRNGYLHFYTEVGGSIIITDQPLKK